MTRNLSAGQPYTNLCNNVTFTICIVYRFSARSLLELVHIATSVAGFENVENCRRRISID